MGYDDDVDLDLLEYMRQHFAAQNAPSKTANTQVLSSAQYIFDNSIDVALDRDGILSAAEKIHGAMTKKQYSTTSWSLHELHPKEKNEDTLEFIFTMDLLNFSFWSEKPDKERFSVTWAGKRWTGYWSLVAALQRALAEGVPITCPYFWVDQSIGTEERLAHVFRSDTEEEIPMLRERIACLREAGRVLCERYSGKISNIIAAAKGSAAALVLLLADEFPCFRDEHVFEGRQVNIYKRAQILVADIWACFDGTSYGTFSDTNTLTMFADYRVPVILHAMGCIYYSPTLEHHIRSKKPLESGHSWELQIRGCAIWAVEMIRRRIESLRPGEGINAVLIDFYLYDTAKEMERRGVEMVECHRTRSIWY
ncbi:hypothetical protein RUND412_004276 [Rhizina undulata]